MNTNPDFGTRRKRKSKKRRKDKKRKRTKLQPSKIFKEASFDSSSDEESTSDKKTGNVLEYQFKEVLNLTPSKSECDISEIVISDSESSSPEIVVLDDDESCILTENSFEFSETDTSITQPYGNILDEFVYNDGGQEETEVISADSFCVKNKKSRDSPVLKAKRKRDAPPVKKAKLKEENKKDSRDSVPLKKKRNQEETPPKKKGKVKAHLIPNDLTDELNQEVQLHHTIEGTIVILEKDQTIYCHGLCSLSVLHGEIEVLGHTLTKNSPEVKLYSPRGSSLLYLRNVTQSDDPVDLHIFLPINFTEKCAVVLCKKLHDPQIPFIEKHMSQQILPNDDHHFPRITFQLNEGSWNLLKMNENWNSVTDRIDKTTKLMICGGKGVGKTTFLRFAINRLLMRFSAIRVMDLDPGQSEFTIPGCISLVTVDKPVFGVNFTHLQQPDRSFLSNINIAYEPEKYIKSVNELLKTTLDEIPTLVNYMGYTHGMGINILSAVIVQVQPTDIVQISSRDSKKNYNLLLTPEVVTENAKLFVSVVPQLNYNLHEIQSMTDRNDGWTAQPRQLREMCVLSHLSQLTDSNSIFNTKVPLFKINLEDIIITDLNGGSIDPAAVNGSLVALSVLVNDEMKIFQCLGWGIVRGIDLVSNELVLLTSEKLETLDKVTHLVANGVTLPPSVYMTPDKAVGAMPYVIEGTLMSFGQIPKRSRMSVKTV